MSKAAVIAKYSKSSGISQLMATTPRPGLETTADYSPIRNPRDGDKLGSA